MLNILDIACSLRAHFKSDERHIAYLDGDARTGFAIPGCGEMQQGTIIPVAPKK